MAAGRFAADQQCAKDEIETGVTASATWCTVTILADGEIFFGHSSMCLIETASTLKRNRMDNVTRRMVARMARISRAPDLGNAPQQLIAMTATALITVLPVGSPVSGQPCVRMLIDAA